MQTAAEAAGFSSHGAHVASTLGAGTGARGKGKEPSEDRHVKRQAELNSISGGGWTLVINGSQGRCAGRPRAPGKVTGHGFSENLLTGQK